MNNTVYDSGYLAQKEHKFKKSWGQNFLKYTKDAQTLTAACALADEELLLEIGCGAGALTSALLASGKKVQAYEVDLSLQAYLEERFAADLASGSLQLSFGNALEVDFYRQFSEMQNLAVISNLPYSLTREFILKILLELPAATTLAFMLQKEAVNRLLAPLPQEQNFNPKLYGTQAVMIALFFKAAKKLSIPRSAFHPLPHVANEFIVLKKTAVFGTIIQDFVNNKLCKLFNITEDMATLKAGENLAEEQDFRVFFFNFLKDAFAQRRKTLVNLKTYNENAALSSALAALAIAANIRAEELKPRQLLEIALYLYYFPKFA